LSDEEKELREAIDVALSKTKLSRRDRRTLNHRIHRAVSVDVITTQWVEVFEQYIIEVQARRFESKRKQGLQRVEDGYLRLRAVRLREFVFNSRAFKHTFGGPNATPRNCELLLSLLLSRTEQDPAIGDFLERYEQKRKRLGRRRADLWAYSEVLRTVWPVLRRKLGTLLKFAVAAEWVRRQFHQ
jgi:hypothetical protein